MISVLAWLVCGALVFVEQDLPGLRVGRAEPLSGERWRNFRQADFDGNGELDLLLPDGIAFQRNSAFRREDRHALPPANGLPACDLWNTTVYLRLPESLACFQWSSDGWLTLFEHPIRWPDREALVQGSDPAPPGDAAELRFERFLHDFNQDGRPEIVVAAEDGLHVFMTDGERYTPAGIFDVFPPLRLVPENPARVWPPDPQRIPVSEMHLSCHLFITQNRVTVLESDIISENRARYRMECFEIAADPGADLELKSLGRQKTPVVPATLRPCRLNPGETIDFAGGQWQFASGGLLHAPVYEMSVSTDFGQSIQSVRSISYRPSCSFVDFNGDGRLDLVAESAGLFEGGVRETVSRLMTARSLKHHIEIHLQDDNGVFPVTPSIRGSFHLSIDQAPARSGERFRRYQASELLDITGDFDGDGIRDAVIHASPREIQVYRGTAAGFGPRPILTAAVEPHWRFAVDDIDGDGRSDIIFRWVDAKGDDEIEQCRVFLTREETR